MMNFIVALLSAVVIAECSSLSGAHVTLLRRSDTCDDLNQCVFPLSKVGSEKLAQLSDSETYDLFCDQHKTFKECYEENNSQCNNDVVVNLVEGKVLVADYICSPEGEKDLTDLLEFPCVSNTTLRIEAQKLIAKCVRTFQEDLEISALEAIINGASEKSIDICSNIEGLNSCIVDGATKKCGQEVGQFVKRVWETASAPSFEKFQCVARSN